MSNNWLDVWSKRNTDSKKINLSELILLNGFDSPLGNMKENDWTNYVDNIIRNYGLNYGSSIFEVGCGSGAFLYPFYNSNYKISGIDFSKNLVSIANRIFKLNTNKIQTCSAEKLDYSNKFHFVVSNHVFHYFPSLNYSFEVLEKMFLKCSKKVILLGLPNYDFKIESENKRRGILTFKEYEKKYSNLNILYFKKDDFKNFAEKKNANVEFFNHQMPGFVQNKFRFDCVISKL